MIPGEFLLKEEEIECNKEREKNIVQVMNTGDRPVQVGSHFHFYEVNKALKFERNKAFGMRLNVPAGAAVRFEPGDEKEVELVAYAGMREVYGFNNKVNGSVEEG